MKYITATFEVFGAIIVGLVGLFVLLARADAANNRKSETMNIEGQFANDFEELAEREAGYANEDMHQAHMDDKFG